MLESHKLEFVFSQVELFSCHHWQRGLFYSLVLWRDCVDDFEWHSSSSTLLFLRTRRLFNHWKKFCFLWHFSWHPYTFFFFTIEFLDCVELRSQANKLFDDFPLASSLNIPGTFLLIPVGIPEGWFGEKFEVSNFSWTSAEISLKKSPVSIS